MWLNYQATTSQGPQVRVEKQGQQVWYWKEKELIPILVIESAPQKRNTSMKTVWLNKKSYKNIWNTKGLIY